MWVRMGPQGQGPSPRASGRRPAAGPSRHWVRRRLPGREVAGCGHPPGRDGYHWWPQWISEHFGRKPRFCLGSVSSHRYGVKFPQSPGLRPMTLFKLEINTSILCTVNQDLVSRSPCLLCWVAPMRDLPSQMSHFSAAGCWGPCELPGRGEAKPVWPVVPQGPRRTWEDGGDPRACVCGQQLPAAQSDSAESRREPQESSLTQSLGLCLNAASRQLGGWRRHLARRTLGCVAVLQIRGPPTNPVAGLCLRRAEPAPWTGARCTPSSAA